LVVAAGCLKSASAQSAISSRQYPVGMKQIEYVDPSDGRHLALAMFYPAMPPATSAVPYRMRFFTNLNFYVDAPIVANEAKRPLVLFSHGHGSNGLYSNTSPREDISSACSTTIAPTPTIRR
jgi:predicted dienelactone hydrolase